MDKVMFQFNPLYSGRLRAIPGDLFVEMIWAVRNEAVIYPGVKQ